MFSPVFHLSNTFMSHLISLFSVFYHILFSFKFQFHHLSSFRCFQWTQQSLISVSSTLSTNLFSSTIFNLKFKFQLPHLPPFWSFHWPEFLILPLSSSLPFHSLPFHQSFLQQLFILKLNWISWWWCVWWSFFLGKSWIISSIHSLISSFHFLLPSYLSSNHLSSLSPDVFTSLSSLNSLHFPSHFIVFHTIPSPSSFWSSIQLPHIPSIWSI